MWVSNYFFQIWFFYIKVKKKLIFLNYFNILILNFKNKKYFFNIVFKLF
jgi:hypothetical protein